MSNYPDPRDQPVTPPDDLDRNPGIGQSPGIDRREGLDPIEGDNTVEGDVENDVDPTAGSILSIAEGITPYGGLALAARRPRRRHPARGGPSLWAAPIAQT